MALLYRDESITKDNHKLEFFTFLNGVGTDVDELRFRIFNVTDQTKRTLFYNPAATEMDWQSIQEFPANPGDYKDVDVVNLADALTSPGHKLGIGHYFAEWTVPDDATPGSYVIVWEYKFVGDADYRLGRLEFVVSQASYFFANEETIADKIRSHMRDHTFDNELVDGFESTDAQLQKAINLTVARYNMKPPRVLTFEVANFPLDMEYALIMGSVAHILQSVSILQLRNQLTYTDGGIHVGLTDKHQLYKVMAKELLMEFDEMIKADKIQRNLEAGWGAVVSPYHGYYTFYGV